MTICSLCISSICNFSLFPVLVLKAGFGFPSHCLLVTFSIVVLIVPGPGHCLSLIEPCC